MAFGSGGQSEDEDQFRVTLESEAELTVDARDRQEAIQKAKNRVRERDYRVFRENAQKTR